MKSYSVLFIFVLLYSCSQNRVPAHFIQINQMRQILWQMSVADQVVESDTSHLTQSHVRDSVTKIYQQILKDNDVNETDYKSSLAYYESKPELMQQLIDTTVYIANTIIDSFNKKKQVKSVASDLDSAEIRKLPTLKNKSLLKSLKPIR